MKKILLLTLLSFCVTTIAQKKKTATAPKNIVVTTNGNASAEVIKDKFYLLIKNGVVKDSMLLKTISTGTKFSPTNCTIKSFSAKGTPLYLVTWNENNTTETKLKKEVASITESQIWNPTTKILQVGNTYSSTQITETVFLDKLKTASETQQRMRKSGLEFVFLGEDFILKDKNSETKYTYNTTTMKYEPAKGKTAPTPTPPTKKKRR